MTVTHRSSWMGGVAARPVWCHRCFIVSRVSLVSVGYFTSPYTVELFAIFHSHPIVTLFFFTHHLVQIRLPKSKVTALLHEGVYANVSLVFWYESNKSSCLIPVLERLLLMLGSRFSKLIFHYVFYYHLGSSLSF